MEISTEKTKLITNNTSSINTEIKGNGQKLETVTSFKYLAQLYLIRVPHLRYSSGSADNSSIDKVETSLE